MAFVMPMFAALGSAAGASAATAGMAGLALTSGAIGVLGAVKSSQQASASAQSQANMANYNAQVADIQAKQAYAQAGSQEDLQRKRARAAIGSQLASNAQAGGGLNTDLLRESLYGAESDALGIRYEGALKANGLTQEAALQRSSSSVALDQKRQAKTSGFLSAAGSVLNAGTSYYKASTKLN